MTARTYRHFCGVAQALDLVGERWALLVVRELLYGPKRYSDLMTGLPGVSTNVLASRLEELEDAGVVQRRTLRPPAASSVYELTAYGRALEEPLLALGRWGAQRLGPPGDMAFRPGWGLLALQASFRPDQAAGLDATFELRVDDDEFTVEVRDERAEISAGAARGEPDLRLATDTDSFLALCMGELDPTRAAEEGRLDLRGDARLLARFFDAFRFIAAG